MKTARTEHRMKADEQSKLVLRGYRPGDWKPMHALDIVCFELPFRFGLREMRRLAEARGAICVLAERDEILSGFCIAHLEDQWAYLVTLDVAPEGRRLGLATRLMGDVEEQARAAGTSGMGLHVYNGNIAAIRFYERMGYDRVAMHEGFYGRGLDALVYRKKW
jgi:[ribosomal protein S18]-alanine N-acetyltransferase